MKHVIRYLLDGDNKVPVFVEDGGYFQIGEELVGISVDDEKRFLPASVHKLTRQQLYDRLALIDPKHRETQQSFSQQERESLVDQFLQQKGLQDYL